MNVCVSDNFRNNMINKIIILIFYLHNFVGIGQNYYDVSFNYSFRTTLSNSTEINSTVKNLEGRYFKQLTPSFNVNFNLIKKKSIYSLSYERAEPFVHNGLRVNQTENHVFFGGGISDGLRVNQFSINYRYNIFNSKRIEQHFGFGFSYLYFKENRNTIAFSILDIRTDSQGNILEKSNVFVGDYDFKRFFNILIGLNYNLIYKLNYNFYLNAGVSYNQGLLRIYDAYSSASVFNYQTNYSGFFEQITKGNLSNFKLDFGIGYRIKRKTQNKVI